MIAVATDFNVLVLTDSQPHALQIENCLTAGGNKPAIVRADTTAKAKKLLVPGKVDVVLADVSSVQKLDAFLRESIRLCPTILIAADKDEVKAQKLLVAASDYLLLSELNPRLIARTIGLHLEKKSIVSKLADWEQRYESLFQNSPLPKWIYDVKTLQFLNVNDAAVRAYGFSREEFLQMSILDIRPKEDVEMVKKRISKLRKEENFAKGSFRHRKKNGDIMDVQIESNHIEFEGRKARLVLAVDMTDRIKSERALLASEKRFKSLIQEGGDLITILQPDGTITYASPNHDAVLGYKPIELANKNIADFIHPDDYYRTIKLYSALLTRKRIFTSQFRFKHKKGHWVWVESIASNTLRDESINGFVVNSRDVTTRVENERRVRETNERFESIVKATSNAIYDYDFATDQIYISGVNYHTLFGYSFEKDTTDLDFFKSKVHPDDVERLWDFFLKSIENPKKTHFEVEYRFLRSNGSYADILDRFNVIWRNGAPQKKIGAMQDISTRKFQETILAFEKEIYELNANPKISFDTVVGKVISNMEVLIPTSICSILQLTDDNKVRHLSGHGLDHNYITAVESMEIGPIAGSCGTAMYTGKSVFVTDIPNSELWKPFLPIVEPYGFKACWSVPVKKRTGKVMASFAVYFKEVREPQKEEVNLLERVANLIGVLIENRNAFEETETAKERYDIVAKATSDTIWDWKIQENTFEWNKGIQGVFGYKKENVGKTSNWWFERIHPEDSIRISVKLYNFLEEKVEKWQDEYRFACADGTYRYVNDRAFLVKDDNGKPIRMIGALQDITKQKEEEQRLKLLETVVTQTKDAVIISESEKASNSIPKIVFVNPAFSQMTGYKSKEVVGKSPAIFMGRKSIANEFAKLSEALRDKKDFKFETLNKKKSGEEYWVNFSMIPITNKEGEHSHWISIQRDITEEKRQEKEKEQLIRELTQNNKDLKQFSYITSHNLRAPLSNLTGLLNLIDDIPVENPELKEVLEGFSKSTHLLNETINDLVKVIIIKDNPSIETEDVLIQDVFENVFNQLSFLISLHKPIIKIELKKVSVPSMNKSYLESILLNLLTNAIKYRATGRQLRINIASKEVGDNIILTFKDNGIGIDLERNADKIFGLYQRFHNYPDSKGLGLYLVKSQVETMGGSITVQSEVNKGTTFTLTFKNKQPQ